MTTDGSASPWVPPFFTCGECGGEIGLYPVINLLSQRILDWRHRSVPSGTVEHRAVLGTPAHGVARKAARNDDPIDADPAGPPPPIQSARPALFHDLPGPAVKLDKLAEEHGWTVRAYYMHGPLMDVRWKFSRMIESVVLHLDRDGHRLVVAWQTKPWPGPPLLVGWELESIYSLTHEVTSLSNAELKAAIKYPRAVCETCGEPPALHVWTKYGPVCHAEHNPSKEVPT